MIQIDKPMPDGCDVCPLMYDYIQCNALPEGCKDDDAFNEEGFDWTKRPEWCPLKEQETNLICNLLGGEPYEVYCKECRMVICRLGKGDDMNTVKGIFTYCPNCGRKVKWDA